MEIIDSIKLAARESNRTVLSLLLEAWRLRRGLGRLGFSEYLDFRLYQTDLSFEAKSEFGGWRAQEVLEQILVDTHSTILTIDKLTMYAMFLGYGFPTPDIRAVYRAQRPQPFVNLDTREALASYLRDPGNLPLYLKPSFGSYGRGNTLVKAVEGDTLVLGNGTTVPIDEFTKSIDDGRTFGWILQEPLSPHAQIAEVCGDKISGVRIHTFLTPNGPQLVKAIFKINVGGRDSDNFQHGASGNMLATVDIETGTVSRVITGTGPGQNTVSVHPRTGAALVGFQLPHWPEIKRLVCEAHLALPGFICPGWDIAICDDGPRILEANAFGDIDLSQHAHRRGFLDKQFVHLMKSRGLDNLLAGNRGLHKKSAKNGRVGLRSHHWTW